MAIVQDWVPAAEPPAPLLAGAIDVWLANLDAADPSIAVGLDDEERARASRYMFARDSRRFSAARGYLRRLLAQYLGVTSTAVKFAYGDWGKPKLAMEGQIRGAPTFNIAHSGSLALIAVGNISAIGVDIEQMRTIDDWRDVAAGNFSDAEYRELSSLPADLQQAAFFACWTRKEALVKFWGTGLSTDLRSFSVSVDPREAVRINTISGLDMKLDDISLCAFQPCAGFWAALATPSAEHKSTQFLKLIL